MSPRRLLPLPLLLVLAGQCAAQLPPSARMGRLFFWPGERAVLDSKRGAAPSALVNPNVPGNDTPPPGAPDTSSTAPTAAPTGPTGPAPVELSGIVHSSSGRTTTWLNAQPSTAGTPVAGGKSVALRLSSGRKLVLKPGQTYDAVRSAVQDGTAVPADQAQGQSLPQYGPPPAPQPPPDFKQ